MLRGIERSLIFGDDHDRHELAARLERVLGESQIACLAIAFMPNHLHLVVRTGPTRLSVAMARIGTGYAMAFNKRHDRVGHLFQNRFKSLPIGSDTQLLATIRYVHLNPLRAGIVESLNALERFPWTGHAPLMGGRGVLPIDVTGVLSLFGDRPDSARHALRSFMTIESAEADTSSDGLCVPALFDPVLDAVAAAFAVAPREMRGGSRRSRVSSARAVLSHIACDHLEMPGIEVARVLGVSETAVRRARERGAMLLSENPWLRRIFDETEDRSVPQVRGK